MSASARCCANCSTAEGPVKLTVVSVRHNTVSGVTTRSRRCPACQTTYRTEERPITMRAPAVKIAASAG
jgi:hypothetical protein